MKLFKLVMEIKSKDGVLHFRRWQILKTSWFSIYFHGIYRKDDDKHLHDHPWNYISIILKGSFFEVYQHEGGEQTIKCLNAISFIKRKATTFHKIYTLNTPAVYTLFITGKEHKEWGYLVNDKFIQHSEYREKKKSGAFDTHLK